MGAWESFTKPCGKVLDRLVALKVILEGQHASAEIQARFRREAAAVARLRHPNVVQIHEIGEHDGRLYFSMEHVAGGSLARWLAGTPQNPLVSACVVEVIARAVQAAHDEGIVHRDLKPANVLLSFSRRFPTGVGNMSRGDSAVGGEERLSDATPKISDFGLAKLVAVDDASLGTHSGAVIGSPSYMAPEQAQSNPHEIGPAADIYALGAILYEMLTGRPPFRAETPVETVIQVLHAEVIPPRRIQPRLSRNVETICLQCLQKEAKRRYSSAAALADDLRRFQMGQPIHARPISVWRRGVKWARRRPAQAALIGVILAAAFALLVGGIWHQARLQAEVSRTKLQQDRAAANLQTAIDVLEHQLNELHAARQRGQSVPPEMNQSLLENSIPFFERLLIEEDQADPTARRAIGRANAGLARTYRMTQNWERGSAFATRH